MAEAKPWQVVASEALLDCRIFAVEQRRARSPHTGDEHTFYRIQTDDWVNIVPVTDRDELVLIRQYRHGVDAVTLEIPGGLIDPGEDPAAAAARECLEETGYAAPKVEPLSVFNPNPALFGNRLHTFVAEGVQAVAAIQNTAMEHTEAVLVPAAALPGLLSEGHINHALVVATLWRYWFWRQQREHP